jgi:hypothetical protein
LHSTPVHACLTDHVRGEAGEALGNASLVAVLRKPGGFGLEAVPAFRRSGHLAGEIDRPDQRIEKASAPPRQATPMTIQVT